MSYRVKPRATSKTPMTTTILMLWFLAMAAVLLTAGTGAAVLNSMRGIHVGAEIGWRFAFTVGAIASPLRIGPLWYLMYRQWTGTESLATIPLLLFVYPEAGMLPTGRNVSAAEALVCSAALFADTFAVVCAAFALVRFASWAIGRRRKPG